MVRVGSVLCHPEGICEGSCSLLWTVGAARNGKTLKLLIMIQENKYCRSKMNSSVLSTSVVPLFTSYKLLLWHLSVQNNENHAMGYYNKMLLIAAVWLMANMYNVLYIWSVIFILPNTDDRSLPLCDSPVMSAPVSTVYTVHRSGHSQSFGIKQAGFCIFIELVANMLYIMSGYQMAVS